uniref:ferredoxin--NADP(+) reductase n=1 Tax=Lotharella globosa TaxID=91324 RepID=A0A7S3YRG1_9EUKA
MAFHHRSSFRTAARPGALGLCALVLGAAVVYLTRPQPPLERFVSGPVNTAKKTAGVLPCRSVRPLVDAPWRAAHQSPGFSYRRENLLARFTAGDERLDYLEATPYYDRSKLPLNTHTKKKPLTGTIEQVTRIVGPKAPGETCEIIINHGGDMPYWEGQSAGIIPPGVDPKRNKPYGTRLYSIASTRYGDDGTGKTMTLTVRRATYFDPELGKEDPAKKGVCSNYLCDAIPGTQVVMTGPSGKVMLMPEESPEAPIIMVGTGTGIAPYRGFLKRLFVENTEAAENYKGLAWLFLGVANTDALLYDADWKQMEEEYPDNFRYTVALSREQKNKKVSRFSPNFFCCVQCACASPWA